MSGYTGGEAGKRSFASSNCGALIMRFEFIQTLEHQPSVLNRQHLRGPKKSTQEPK